MREPFVLPFAAITAGILLSRSVPFHFTELFVSIGCLVALAALSIWYGCRVTAFASLILSFVAAGLLTGISHRPPPTPELSTEDRVEVILSGCVVEPSLFNVDREQFVLELEPGVRVRATLPVREGETPPELEYGQRIEFVGKTRRPHNFRNPGGFDYVHYLARQSVFFTASAVSGEPVRRLEGTCGSPFWRAIYGMRSAGLRRIEDLYRTSEYNIAMMQAVLIGETARLQRIWTEDYRSTGTFHALVISGSHVAVLAAFLLFLLRICFVPRGWAALLTILAAWLYAFVTGWQAPVIRSAAAMTLFGCGRWLYRESRMLNILAAVALVFVAADPEQLLDPSFQLSFLSVALIAAFVVPIIERTSGPVAAAFPGLTDTSRDVHLSPRTAQLRVELRMLASTVQLLVPQLNVKAASLAVTVPARILVYFYELLLTSAIIQIGLALPMAIYFHRISFSGLSANAIVVPLLGIVVPLGFVAVFTGSQYVANTAAWLLDLSRITVEWHGRMEPHWRIPTPPVWLALALALSLLLAAIRWRWNWVRFAAGVSVVVALALLVWHPFAPVIQPGQLELTAIDVGQGDSILVSFPDGTLMLMDGGGIPNFGRKLKGKIDIGEDVVSPYLWTRSIRRLDVVALSHAHEDHLGGLRAVLDNFEVKELWTGATPDSPGWNALREKAISHGIAIKSLRRGAEYRFGGAGVNVLSPSADYLPKKAPGNPDSLALRITYGRHSFLLTGDMDKHTEAELLNASLVAKTDVLKVGHHGSKTASSPEFLDALHPTFAIISVGNENQYNLPALQTVKALSERRMYTMRTDRDGLVSVRSDGRYLTALPEEVASRR